MYKLLTREERDRVETEYRARRSHAALMLATFLMVFTIVAMAPALISSLGRKNAATLAVSSARTMGQNTEGQALLRWAQSERLTLAALAPVMATSTPYTYFQKILATKPADIRITSLAYAKSSKSIAVTGRAPSRQTLLNFQSSLVASGGFAKVDFPVDNLAKESNIDFQLSLTPNQ